MGLIAILLVLAALAATVPQAAPTPPAAVVTATPAVEQLPPAPLAGSPEPLQQTPFEPTTELPVRDEEPLRDRDVIVTGRDNRGDPAAPLNAASFEGTQVVDDVLVAPLTRVYTSVLPRPARDGVRNFIGNLREPIVAANYLLQLKPGKAAETLGRFVLNTTIGVVGLIDIAKRKPFRLPRRRNSFGNTLGFYGVKPGPFFFLPIVGPTTLRDLLGTGVDQALIPIGALPPLNDPTAALAIRGLGILSYREQIDDDLKDIRATPDPYAARRKAYLDRRQTEIDALRGRSKVKSTSDDVTNDRLSRPEPAIVRP